MNLSEIEKVRRAKISNALSAYYKSEKGIEHRSKISKLQKQRMNEYNNYLKNRMYGISN